jgi:hypothetical protein
MWSRELVALVHIECGAVILHECAVTGSPRVGILLASGARAEIRGSLVAGTWASGIIVGDREDAGKCNHHP